MDITMLIDGAEAESEGKAQFERLNPVTGKVATRAPAAGRADVDRAVEAAAAAFPAWAATGPNARRAILLKAADALDARTAGIHRDRDGRDRRHRPLDRLQRLLRRPDAARGGGDDDPGRRRDHPLRQARHAGDGAARAGRRPGRDGALERPGHPRRPRRRDAARLRQHGRLQGLRDVPGDAPADRRDPERRRAAEGRPQHHHAFGGRRARGRLGADRAPEGAPDQLHRLDPGGADRRGAGRAAPEAGPARARRQGSARRPRRCRPRRRGQRRRLRRPS